MQQRVKSVAMMCFALCVGACDVVDPTKSAAPEDRQVVSARRSKAATDAYQRLLDYRVQRIAVLKNALRGGWIDRTEGVRELERQERGRDSAQHWLEEAVNSPRRSSEVELNEWPTMPDPSIFNYYSTMDVRSGKYGAEQSIVGLAIHEFTITGSAQVGGVSYQLSANVAEPLPLPGIGRQFDLPGKCADAAIDANTSTFHEAGIRVFGYGLTPITKTSYQHGECKQTAVITVTVTSSNIFVGKTTQATIVAKNVSGTTLACDAVFASNNEDVMTVSSTGEVTGVAWGTASVVGECDNLEGWASAQVVVTTPPVCTEAGTDSISSGASLRTARLVSVEADSTCGDQTTPPGSGGGEPPPPPPDGGGQIGYTCGYVRYYKEYSDGSWEWITDWMWDCWLEYQELRAMRFTAAASSGDTTMEGVRIASANAKTKRRIRLILGDKTRSGRAIELHRYSSLDADLAILVREDAATAADLDLALSAVGRFVRRPEAGHLTAIVGAPSDGRRREVEANAQLQAVVMLRALKAAGREKTKLAGDARTIVVEVIR